MSKPASGPQTDEGKKKLFAYYGEILPAMMEAARACGYALAVHGSAERDLDLIALAWVDDPDSPDDLADAVAKSIGVKFSHRVEAPTGKRHRELYHIVTPMYLRFDPVPPSGKVSAGFIELSVARTVKRAIAREE